MLKLAKEQMIVVRSSLRTVNFTLADVAANEIQLNDNLNVIQKLVAENREKTSQVLSQAILLSAVNQHMIIVEHLVSQLREEYDIILSAITFAQKGILFPQIITPEDIIEAFQQSQSILPTDLSLPSTARVAYKHVLMDIVDIDVFLNDNILGHILRIPLVHCVVYNLYKLIPFPTKVRNSEDTFVFISSEENYLLMDTLKQIYAKLSDLQVGKCKTISPELRMCKQVFPLKSKHLHQECEAKLLEPTITIPPDCNKKIITLNEVVWWPLSHNKWIFASPEREKVTIMCNSLNPSDVIVQGTDILSMLGRCDAFGPVQKSKPNQLLEVIRQTRISFLT
jgi:hypothetical protein